MTCPTLPDDDGFGAGPISSENEVQRRGTAGLLDEGRRTGVTEERIGRAVAGIRESAERIARAEQHARGAAMRTE